MVKNRVFNNNAFRPELHVNNFGFDHHSEMAGYYFKNVCNRASSNVAMTSMDSPEHGNKKYFKHTSENLKIECFADFLRESCSYRTKVAICETTGISIQRMSDPSCL